MSKFFEESYDTVKEKNPYIDEMKVSSINCPSQGVFYPKNLVVSYRLYSFGELKFLTPKVLKEENPDTVKDYIDTCLKGITLSDPSFNKYDLCYYDFIYLSIIRKFPSIAKNPEEPYDVASRCPHCGNMNISALDIMSIQFNEYKYLEPIKISISKEVIYEFTPLTIKSYLKMLDFKSKSKNELDLDVLFIASCVNSDEPLENIYNTIYSIQNRNVILKLQELEDSLSLSLLPYLLQCSNCQEDYYLKLDSNKIEYSLAFPIFSKDGELNSYYKSLLELSKRLSKHFNISILDVNYMSLNDILLLLENSNSD